MTQTPPLYMETYTKISPIIAIKQDRTKLLSLLSTPFELQTKHRLSWITLRECTQKKKKNIERMPLNVVVQEAHEE